jgi:hypothetical protein
MGSGRAVGRVAAVALTAVGLMFLALPASAAGLLTQAPLVIAFTGFPGTTQTLSTTGGSGSGAVTFAIGQVNHSCVLKGNVLDVRGLTGWCDIVATKAGDANYSPESVTALSPYFSYLAGPPTTPKRPVHHRRRR